MILFSYKGTYRLAAENMCKYNSDIKSLKSVNTLKYKKITKETQSRNGNQNVRKFNHI